MGGKCLTESKEIICFLYGEGVCSLHSLFSSKSHPGLVSWRMGGKRLVFFFFRSIILHSHQTPRKCQVSVFVLQDMVLAPVSKCVEDLVGAVSMPSGSAASPLQHWGLL